MDTQKTDNKALINVVDSNKKPTIQPDTNAKRSGKGRLSPKAQITYASLVAAAAAILRTEDPRSVTYRHVAEWAGTSSSSVGYYFESITDLLHEAASYNMRLWAQRAEKAAFDAEQLSHQIAHEQCIDYLLRACLPEGLSVPASHYAQLIAAAESEVVTETYRLGRRRLDLAVERILLHVGYDINPGLIVSIVDGAAVGGISEGRDVREIAVTLLTEILRII